jgi:hypothetical protein
MNRVRPVLKRFTGNDNCKNCGGIIGLKELQAKPTLGSTKETTLGC